MDIYSNVNNVLTEVTTIKKGNVFNCSIRVSGMTVIRLRDILTEIGKIHRELLDRQMYVSVIPGGFLRRNHAIVVTELLNDELIIAAYADEGLINQHTCEGVIDEFRRAIGKYISE